MADFGDRCLRIGYRDSTSQVGDACFLGFVGFWLSAVSVCGSQRSSRLEGAPSAEVRWPRCGGHPSRTSSLKLGLRIIKRIRFRVYSEVNAVRQFSGVTSCSLQQINRLLLYSEVGRFMW